MWGRLKSDLGLRLFRISARKIANAHTPIPKHSTAITMELDSLLTISSVNLIGVTYVYSNYVTKYILYCTIYIILQVTWVRKNTFSKSHSFTRLGLYPENGSSYFLPRLPGELGTYLGLTGSRLKGEELVDSGLATHFIMRGDGSVSISSVPAPNHTIYESQFVCQWKPWIARAIPQLKRGRNGDNETIVNWFSIAMQCMGLQVCSMHSHIHVPEFHTCPPIKIPDIQFLWTLWSHSSKPLPPTTRILPYLTYIWAQLSKI